MGVNNPGYAFALVDLGRLNIRTGKYEKAESYLAEAKTILDKELGEENPANGEVYFNLGTLYAVKKDNTKALEYLEKAFQLKYHDLKSLESTKDLDAIRVTPEFKKLIEKYFPDKQLDRFPGMFSVR